MWLEGEVQKEEEGEGKRRRFLDQERVLAGVLKVCVHEKTDI